MRYLFFCASFILLLATGCGGGGPQWPTHEPTESELQVTLGQAFDDVFKNQEMRADTLARLIGPKIAWAQMGADERERHMARTVMPVMLTLFQSFDKGSGAEDFDQAYFQRRSTGSFGFRSGEKTTLSNSFSCLTCHGDSFTSTRTTDFDFSRPTHLYPLDPNNLPTVENPGQSSARVIAFMQYTVTPAIRILLGRPDANCFTCHQVKK